VRKPIRLTASLAIAALVFSAAPAAGQDDMTADFNLREDGKLIVAYFPSPGISDVVDGEFLGWSAFLDLEVAKRLGLELVPSSFDFAAIFPALQSHRVDMIGAAMAGTQPRAQVLWLINPMQLVGAETIIVRPGTELSSWEEAAEKDLTLASVKGYFQITAWEDLGIEVHAFDNNDACMTDVLNGGADGCAIGAFGLIYRQATLPGDPLSGLDQVEMTGPRIVLDNSTIAVAKDNPEMANAVSQIFKDMWRDGTVDAAGRSAFGDVDFSLFLAPPVGGNLYVVGPWEEGVVPPTPETYPEFTTLNEGTLTVGVLGDSPMLQLADGAISGPEAQIVQFAADELGLTLDVVSIDDDAAALRGDEVDVVVGKLETTPERTSQYWMTQVPVGFSPDYIYVTGSGGSSTSWEELTADGGALSVVAGDPRIDDIQAVGVEVQEFPDATAALLAVADGSAAGFVGTTLDYVTAASADQSISETVTGWLRNSNTKTLGHAFGWGVKAGNAGLVDALDQAVTKAWQDKIVAGAYFDAFPGANTVALQAPGPALVGTGFSEGSSKDYKWRGMWMSGAWLQRPGMVE
jgi:cystine transport system substrate-binding protein